uniref:Uncharacterized protein n=1 Tax=Lepeophtheirus salmonis TaxID=72036 RepID=A0A0K2TV58_LEPSM
MIQRRNHCTFITQ